MVNFLLGMLTCYLFTGALLFIVCECTNHDYILDNFFIPAYAVIYIVCFIPVTIMKIFYGLFRNVVKPTTFANLARAKKAYPSHWHDYGYWGWCYDPNAKFLHKFFFYRIKKGLTD